MLKKLKEKREELESRGSAGFTLMELIIVIAILAMLIGMLLPRFANYTDKAMGTAAGVDTKNILTVATAYNLDNTTMIDLTELQKETGLNTTGVGGKTLVQGASPTLFTYTYTRGGATVTATIDMQTSTIHYIVHGTDGKPDFDSNSIPTTGVKSDTQAGRIAKGLGF